MTKYEYVEEQAKYCGGDWFKDHIARMIVSLPEIQVLQWRKRDNSSIYACEYIIRGRTLLVHGDIGEAVYCWGSRIDLPFLAQTGFDYFWGKCQASEVGRRMESWNPRVAWDSFEDYLSQWKREISPKQLRILRNITKETPQDEYEITVREAYEEAGLDSEMASILTGCGRVPHVRAIGHWVGLIMSHEQLYPKIPQTPA